MLQEIENGIGKAKEALRSIGYLAEGVSAWEFYDYMKEETFSGDITTLEEVLEDKYPLVHELVEINELKKMRQTVNKRVIVDSPKTLIHDEHLTAMEAEFNYALRKNYPCIKARLRRYKESRPRAERLFKRFRKIVEKT